MIRWLAPPILLLTELFLSGCATPLQSQKPPEKWTTGFWSWQDYQDPVPDSETLDVLYAAAGRISFEKFSRPPSWHAFGTMSPHLPAAREYWAVFRYDQAGVPDTPSVSPLADSMRDILADARRRGINVAGVQLDIDSPTSRLPQYAKYLSEVRKALPDGTQISITALLDWFRDGTEIAQVIQQVDEFVPQFYDIGSDYRGAVSIAAKFDGAQWGPRFSKFGKRYRIGISTFGRAKYIPVAGNAGPNYPSVLYRDLSPMDLGTMAGFALHASHNDAGELVVSYKATQKQRIEYNELQAGDTFQLIVPTPGAVSAAVQGARKMQGAVGVVFFRWPGEQEALVMSPDEVLRAAGVRTGPAPKVDVEPVDGACVSVKCADLYLRHASRYEEERVTYRIQSSEEFEYFLPQEHVPVRLAGPAEVEVTLPPYSGQDRLFLGRAVTEGPAKYTLEVRP